MIDITQYAEKIRQRIEGFLAEQLPEKTTHRCSLNITAQNVSLIHMNKTKQSTELLLAKSFAYTNPNELSDLLTTIVTQHQLQEIPLFLLLNINEYQIFMIETLPVSNNEMLAALGFRLRSLMSTPIEDAVIDYFTLPPKKSTPTQPMVAAIAANKSALATKVDMIKSSKIELTTIDIPELALRNLAALHETDNKSTVILYFTDNTVILNISHQKQLYFTRRIQFRQSDEASSYEQLCLEIVRYFDYFQSQWRFPNPTRIFVVTDQHQREQIAKTLSEYLLITVVPYPLAGLSGSPDHLAIAQDHLLTLGCALREGEQHVTSGH